MKLTTTEPLPLERVAQGESSHDALRSDTELAGDFRHCAGAQQSSRSCVCAWNACSPRLIAAYEVIVVDDASTDETAQVAAELGAIVVHRGQCRGPAGRGIAAPSSPEARYLFFLDSDVCVYPETLQELHDTFEREPDLDAVFGSYDSQPTARNVLSQYKNLFHHFVHQDSHEQATTFWSGCGAVRRSVFLKMGGFSASYKRPSIEDIELGMRLHSAGHRIMLNKRIQVTHLKRWTLWSIVKTDVHRSGHPVDRADAAGGEHAQ